MNYIYINKNNKIVRNAPSIIEKKKYLSKPVVKDLGVISYGDENIQYYRFNIKKGWDRNTAKMFVNLSNIVEKSSLTDCVKNINVAEDKYINNKIRKNLYNLIEEQANKQEVKIEPLLAQKEYKEMKNIKEKMKQLVGLSNMKFQEFMDYSIKNRLNIVKSIEEQEKLVDKGYKILGTVNAYKQVYKSENGEEKENWRIKTRFTSNKADSTLDITSKEAIIKAIAELQNKVIPIRFEHESLDYGVWDKFYTEEENGILFGYAEGELYQEYSRSKDLWHDIYELNKQFATSYGGRWVEFHWLEDETTQGVLRVFDEIVFEEISLTTRPANPDTAIVVLNKYATKLESNLRDDINYQEIKDMKKNKEIVTEDVTKNNNETLVVDTQEQAAEETVENTVEPSIVDDSEQKSSTKEDVTPSEDVKSEEVPVETKEETISGEEVEKSVEKRDDSNAEIMKMFKNLDKTIKSLENKIRMLEEQPSERKSIASFKDSEIEKSVSVEEKEQEITKAQTDEIQKRYPFASAVINRTGITI